MAVAPKVGLSKATHASTILQIQHTAPLQWRQPTRLYHNHDLDVRLAENQWMNDVRGISHIPMSRRQPFAADCLNVRFEQVTRMAAISEFDQRPRVRVW